jgi:hypothetical protein
MVFAVLYVFLRRLKTEVAKAKVPGCVQFAAVEANLIEV